MSVLAELRRAFFEAVGRGARAEAHEIALELVGADPGESDRWRGWVDATRPGRRVVMKTCEVDLMVGDELRAVEELREEMRDETLIERLGEEG